MTSAPFDADIVLVGGGLAGLSFALAAGQAGLSVLVLDAATPATSLASGFDGRVSALGRASTRPMSGGPDTQPVTPSVMAASTP